MTSKSLTAFASGIIALAVVPSPAASQNMDVPGVIVACGTPEEAWISFCNGYVQAVYDTAALSGVSICPPSGTTRAAMADTVFRFLNVMQDQAGADALAGVPGAAAVTLALERHYPC